jgi:N6-L-threonylcarbamoyladenine synthase
MGKTILGIETSCDETAASVVVDGYEVLSNVVASQIAKHAPFGGVVPELAAREHLRNISMVVESAISESGMSVSDIDAVAVTNGPGLLPALLVGLNFAKGFSAAHNLPLIGVNHFSAHIYGAFLDFGVDLLRSDDTYPILALVVSGGHTSLVLVDGAGSAEIVGGTIDDAAGEAFDKGAKLLSLGYPGGPIIEKLAKKGDPAKFAFPRPLIGRGGKAVKPENRFNFSFSGIKTALLYHARDIREDCALDDQVLFDTLASYQAAIVDTLAIKTMDAMRRFNVKSVVVCGGVACNGALRERLRSDVESAGNAFYAAPPKYCTDNAAMIAGFANSLLSSSEVNDENEIDAFTRNPHGSPLPFPR